MQTEEYTRHFELEDRYWWYVARRRLALRLVSRYLPPDPNTRLLDVGCGTGAVLKELGTLGWAVGVDFSEVALGFSLERSLEGLVLGDAQAIPLREASFDAVITLDTIEHLEHDGRAMDEIARVLKPGGLLMMNVPAFRWLWGPHDVALMHKRRYTRGQVRELLLRHGFRVQKLSYSVFLFFPLVVVIRAFEKRRTGPARASLPPVPDWLNRLLVWVMDLEGRMVLASSLPWGSSVVAIARKPGGANEA